MFKDSVSHVLIILMSSMINSVGGELEFILRPPKISLKMLEETSNNIPGNLPLLVDSFQNFRLFDFVLVFRLLSCLDILICLISFWFFVRCRAWIFSSEIGFFVFSFD